MTRIPLSDKLDFYITKTIDLGLWEVLVSVDYFADSVRPFIVILQRLLFVVFHFNLFSKLSV